MPLIEKLENKYGRFAIPNLLRLILGMQAITFIIGLANQNLYKIIQFDAVLIRSGEIWRAFTYFGIPRTSDPIFVIFALLILFIISEGLEEAWGSFRVNVYVFGGWVAVMLGVLIMPYAINAVPSWALFYAPAFLAFATFFPDREFLLFFVIPVKVKWLGWLMGAVLIWGMLSRGNPAYVVALANYLIAFVPGLIRGMKQRAETQARQADFKARSMSEEEAFHHCEVCGRTEVDYPHLDFRMAGDGNEYCVDHLPPKD